MRDPKRIDQVLKRVKKVWARSPDLRLGQLLVNGAGVHCPVLFILEDDMLLERLEEMFADDGRGKSQ